MIRLLFQRGVGTFTAGCGNIFPKVPSLRSARLLGATTAATICEAQEANTAATICEAPRSYFRSYVLRGLSYAVPGGPIVLGRLRSSRVSGRRNGRNIEIKNTQHVQIPGTTGHIVTSCSLVGQMWLSSGLVCQSVWSVVDRDCWSLWVWFLWTLPRGVLRSKAGRGDSPGEARTTAWCHGSSAWGLRRLQGGRGCNPWVRGQVARAAMYSKTGYPRILRGLQPWGGLRPPQGKYCYQ